jgi:hypothetical protein
MKGFVQDIDGIGLQTNNVPLKSYPPYSSPYGPRE